MSLLLEVYSSAGQATGRRLALRVQHCEHEVASVRVCMVGGFRTYMGSFLN